MTEAQARERLRQGRHLQDDVPADEGDAVAARDDRIFMKLVVDGSERPGGRRATSSGPDAAEMIQMAGIAVKMGATKADFDAHHGACIRPRRKSW